MGGGFIISRVSIDLQLVAALHISIILIFLKYQYEIRDGWRFYYILIIDRFAIGGEPYISLSSKYYPSISVKFAMGDWWRPYIYL